MLHTLKRTIIRIKTLLGDYNDGSGFNTATQVDFNQLSMLPELHDQRLELGTTAGTLGCWCRAQFL